MAEVIWSDLALNDVKDIFDDTAKDSNDRAALFIERLVQTVDRLENYPRSGRVIEEIDRDECREIIFGSYRIMYEIKGEAVRISCVVHSARNWKPEQ